MAARAFRFVWKTLRTLLSAAILLIFAIWILFKIPAVQNWLADQAAVIISHQLGSKVSIGKVDIQLFDKIILQDFYVEDVNQDTMLFAVEAIAYVDISDILQGRLNITEAHLHNAFFQMLRYEGQSKHNIQHLIEFLEPKNKNNKKKKKAGPEVNIRYIHVHNSRFRLYDEPPGIEINMQIPDASMRNKQSDITNNWVFADSFTMQKPIVNVRAFQGVGFPVDSNALKPYGIFGWKKPFVPKPWYATADKFRIYDMTFNLLNEKIGVNESLPLDFSDLQLSEVNLIFDSLCLRNDSLQTQIKQFALKERRGMQIDSINGQLLVSPNGSHLKDFWLYTPKSVIGNQLEFQHEQFPDFLDFVHKVKIKATLETSSVAMSDIMAFAPPLNKNIFFKTNKDKVAQLSGRFKGKIEDFHIRDIFMQVGNTIVEGEMDLRPFEKFMYLKSNNLETNYNDLRSILGFIKLPPEMARIGKYHFEGDFIGYFDSDFTAYGLLQTPIGIARADIKMNLHGGPNKTSYEGDITLNNFDLGKMLDNPDLGKTTISTRIKGKGLNIASVDAHLDNAKIDFFEFKNYRYDTIFLDGQFRQKRFDGAIASRDSNFSVQIIGFADFNPKLPVINVFGSLGAIRLHKLNLMPETFMLGIDKFRINMEGDRIDNLSGEMALHEIDFVRPWGQYHLDSLLLFARDTLIEADSSLSRIMHLESDIVQATILGQYDMVNLPKALRHYAEKHYPNFVKNIDYVQASDSLELVEAISDSSKIEADSLIAQNVHLHLKMLDSKRLTELIDDDFKYIKDLEIKVDFDSKKDSVSFSLDIGKLRFGAFYLEGENLKGAGKEDKFQLANTIQFIQLNDTTRLPSPIVSFNADGDTIAFNIIIDEIGKVASNIKLNGNLAFTPQKARISVDNSNLSIFNQPWYVKGNNYLEFDFVRKALAVENLRLMDSLSWQIIYVSSIGDKGIRLGVSRFDLGWLYSLVKLPQIEADGVLFAELSVQDIFKQKGLTGHATLKDLVINKDKWGDAFITVEADSLKAPIRGDLKHSGTVVDSLYAKFNFIPTFAAQEDWQKNYLTIDFLVKNAKARVLEYFMVGQISNTVGLVNSTGKIYGKVPKLNIRGDADVANVATTVNFLNTRYNMAKGKLKLRNDAIRFAPDIIEDEFGEYISGGIPITDQEGNKGFIGGAITHKHLKELGLDMHIYLKNTLTLNTDKTSGMPFYGKVYADGNAHFVGPLSKLKLNINGKTKTSPTGEKSLLVLPLGDPLEVTQAVDYVVFVDKVKAANDSLKNAKPIKVATGGLDVEMQITATPDAIARLIIDESAGDIIEGRGKGNLRLTYSASGEMGLYGNYEITNGEYLFTYRNFINKKFQVEPGGTILWEGDPYDATINMRAKYIQPSRLYNLLISYQSELQDTDLRNKANQPVDVEVIMDMKGSLMKPDIKFDLNLTEKIDGKLGSLAGLALRAIRQDETKLNRQVFALIALNQFLPEENAASNLNLAASSFNTLSELISQQFSRYFTDLLSEVFEDVDFISSVDFSFGYKLQDEQQDNAGTGSQLNVGLDQYFMQDRLRVHIGTNMAFGSNTAVGTNTNNIGGDFIIEYAITKDGQLKVRAYNRTESNLFGPRVRTGIGISYQKEFDNFADLFRDMKSNIKKQKNENKLN